MENAELTDTTLLISDTSNGPAVNANKNTDPFEGMVSLLYSPSYEGALTLQLENGNGIQLKNERLFEATDPSQTTVVQALNKVLRETPSVRVSSAFGANREAVLERARELERISGQTAPDFLAFYRVEAGKAKDAESFMRKLKGVKGIKTVFPKLKLYPTSIEDVPDLSVHQSYLKSFDQGFGINAEAAWAREVYGEGGIIADFEGDMAFTHEDVPLSTDLIANGGNLMGGLTPDSLLCQNRHYRQCEEAMAHGVAVAGIVNAQHDGDHGVKGIAPEGQFVLMDGNDDTYDFDEIFDGIGEIPDTELPPGSILLFEVGTPGVRSTGDCFVDQYGCMPVEYNPEFFVRMQAAAQAGITVIAGSANGSMDLDDETLYLPGAPNLAREDSGSIMVGAITAGSTERPYWANHGSTIDAVAQGTSVVTTAWPSPLYNLDWDLTPNGPDAPNATPETTFTNRFAGTSPSAAIIAGAATLLQSHAKATMGEFRYVRPWKVREILRASSIQQVPQMDQALDRVESLWDRTYDHFRALQNGTPLIFTDYQAMEAMGVGLICRKRQPARSDLSCPDELLWPAEGDCPVEEMNRGDRVPNMAWYPGCGIAKSLDMDGDQKADLVLWTRDKWKVDLSRSGGVGAWDMEVTLPATENNVWPVVEDYNSDGRADLAVWDKTAGHWKILFTTNVLLSSRRSAPVAWDWDLNYEAYRDVRSTNLSQVVYNRPVPDDYNGDGMIDLALQTSDGFWRVDYGGPTQSDYQSFDENWNYLGPLTAAQRGGAYGWAYLPVYPYHYMRFKVPDSAPLGGKILGYLSDFNVLLDVTGPGWFDGTPPSGEVFLGPGYFGGNNEVPLGNANDDINIVTPGERWAIYTVASEYSNPSMMDSNNDFFGDNSCSPFIAEFSSDYLDDRATLCSDGFHIAYSRVIVDQDDNYHYYADPQPVIRHTPAGIDEYTGFALPGRPYFGGITYAEVLHRIEEQLFLAPNTPPSIPVDMAKPGR